MEGSVRVGLGDRRRAIRSVATIIISEQPTPAARLAARELQYHIEEITGAMLPIRHLADAAKGPADSTQGTRILVGESGATRKLGLKGEDFESQEYLIRGQGETIILMGRDWHDTPANRGEKGRGMQYTLDDTRKTIAYHVAVGRDDGPAEQVELPGLMDEQGTCYAVYDFLERFGGVRWYGPSSLNIVIPSKKIVCSTRDGNTSHPIAPSPLRARWRLANPSRAVEFSPWYPERPVPSPHSSTRWRRR